MQNSKFLKNNICSSQNLKCRKINKCLVLCIYSQPLCLLFCRWNITVRSTDVAGSYVDTVFTFEVKDRNDPPTSLKVFSI